MNLEISIKSALTVSSRASDHLHLGLLKQDIIDVIVCYLSLINCLSFVCDTYAIDKINVKFSQILQT